MDDGFLFLRDIVIVLGLGFIGAFIARRLRLPLLLGYLLSGFAFTIVTSGRFTFDESLQTLSEIGIALLLFTLGVEFSLSRLNKVRNVAIIGGIFQILLTIAATSIILPNFGFTIAQSVFLGAVFSLSSTAVVVKILTDKGELDTVHGEVLVGMLLLQDLAVVPMMILLPQILTIETFTFSSMLAISIAIGKAAAILIATFALGKTLMPILLTRIGRLNSRELLLLGVMFIALLFALFASFLGLPASIGAFLAGLIMSETIEQHAVFSQIRPLRDIFSIIFFVLLGMLLTPLFFFSNLIPILLLFAFIVIIKSVIVFALLIAFSYHTKISFLVAGSLTSVGEFAFVLAGLFLTQDLISTSLYNLVLSTSLLTILITPWQITLAPAFYRSFKRIVRRNPHIYNILFGKQDFDHSFTQELPFENHVVILGHGRVGRVVSHILGRANIPFVGVDFNLAVVEVLKKKGIPFVYGDPSDLEVLDFAQVDKARAVVVAVPDRQTQEMIIRNALILNPKVKIIVRSHFEDDREYLLASGANSVIAPEREAGLSIAQKILSLYGKS